ncbi:MAG: hypothetical protein AB7I98_20240, partial [Verrucomicrobiales bacterium]
MDRRGGTTKPGDPPAQIEFPKSSLSDWGTKKPTAPADRGVGWILATTYSRTAYRRTTIGAAA